LDNILDIGEEKYQKCHDEKFSNDITQIERICGISIYCCRDDFWYHQIETVTEESEKYEPNNHPQIRL